ncbi:hypothetical protein D9M69_659460 [compost metagenome]
MLTAVCCCALSGAPPFCCRRLMTTCDLTWVSMPPTACSSAFCAPLMATSFSTEAALARVV